MTKEWAWDATPGPEHPVNPELEEHAKRVSTIVALTCENHELRRTVKLLEERCRELEAKEPPDPWAPLFVAGVALCIVGGLALALSVALKMGW